jgi:hypothetical protein
MQKPRPKQATAPRQQRPTRENRGSNEGASAPFVIPGGEKAAENPAKEANSGALQQANEARARKPDTGPAVIVFGFNEHRIPQASWFSEAEADLATRAARLMGLRVLRIETEAHRALAARLRQGQVYAADRTFAPAVQREIFDKLCELAGPVAAPSPVDVTEHKDEATARPASWQAIRVGDLVIAHESPDDGWWEAIVVAIEKDQLVLRWRDYARTPCAPGPLGCRTAAPGRCRLAARDSRLTNPVASAAHALAPPLFLSPQRLTPAAQRPPLLGSDTCVLNP